MPAVLNELRAFILSLFLCAPSDHPGLGELDHLTSVQAPVAGDHKGNHTYKGEQMHVGAAKHLNAQHNGCKGRIGHCAEQPHQHKGLPASNVNSAEAGNPAPDLYTASRPASPSSTAGQEKAYRIFLRAREWIIPIPASTERGISRKSTHHKGGRGLGTV